MKKPWQIWSLFLLCLIAIGVVMTWLSVTTVRLDALRESDRIETELARREAELQGRINSALYRMDLMLLPLVSEEAGRPYYLYDSFYQAFNPTAPAATPSPTQVPIDAIVPSMLLLRPTKFVSVHFQIEPENQLTSPQLPIGDEYRMATGEFGISKKAIAMSSASLELAQEFCIYETLLPEFPEIELPMLAASTRQLPRFDVAPNVYHVPGVDKIRAQNRTSNASSSLPQLGNKIAVQRSRGAGRASEEFNRRSDSTQQLAQQPLANNLFVNQQPLGNYSQTSIGQLDLSATGVIRQGVMRPIWIGGQLILARRVDGKTEPVIQGCWLDWEAIQVALKERVADLLPTVEFQPLDVDSELDTRIALTTLPIQLVIDTPQLLSALAIDSDSVPTGASGLKASLAFAWCGFGVAALASGLLLLGVMRLSERRATFVSAVTHELRTPLTTFRMYAEMMAEGMVPEGKQVEYATTLKIEADRLSHLVENVLQFARLEQGPATIHNMETLTIRDLMDRFSSRLVERAHDSNMLVSIQLDDSVSKTAITTQPTSVEQVLFNFVDNACKYASGAADNRIEISCCSHWKTVQFRVRDFGPGVDPKYKKRMFQPFCKSDLEAANTAPGVGLGLALCQRMARSIGGRLFYDGDDSGATFVLELPV